MSISDTDLVFKYRIHPDLARNLVPMFNHAFKLGLQGSKYTTYSDKWVQDVFHARPDIVEDVHDVWRIGQITRLLSAKVHVVVTWPLEGVEAPKSQHVFPLPFYINYW